MFRPITRRWGIRLRSTQRYTVWGADAKEARGVPDGQRHFSDRRLRRIARPDHQFCLSMLVLLQERAGRSHMLAHGSRIRPEELSPNCRVVLALHHYHMFQGFNELRQSTPVPLRLARITALDREFARVPQRWSLGAWSRRYTSALMTRSRCSRRATLQLRAGSLRVAHLSEGGTPALSRSSQTSGRFSSESQESPYLARIAATFA